MRLMVVPVLVAGTAMKDSDAGPDPGMAYPARRVR